MEELKVEPKLYSFLNIIHKETNTVEEAEAGIIQALSEVADEVRLGEASINVTSPSSKLRQSGLNHQCLLYHYDGKICSESYEIVYPIRDGGTFTATIKARGEEPFNDEEKQVIDLLVREMFLKYSRQTVMDLLQHVVMCDLDTGANTLAALMRQASIYIAKHEIQNYNILFFNIHNFKYVNKVFAYSEGDVVLREYVGTLLANLQEGEILTRLGGDNFVALIKNEHVDAYINLLQDFKLKHSDGEKEKTFLLGATLGYSELNNVNSPRDLMSRASIAYQAARRLGAGSIMKYSEKVHQMLMSRQEILSDFQAALRNGEFVVYYQPKVDLSTHKISGAEALARWIKNGEIVAPNLFIPLLEEEGSVVLLDYFVLDKTCAYLKKRIDEGKEIVPISVNFSRRHLEDDDLIEKTLAIIDKYDIDRKFIEIELTESNDYQNYEKIRKIVKQLDDSGVSTSMDDFGTGFSSLNLIKEVNFDVIKIDKSLIPLDSDYVDKEKDLILFEHLIQLIHQLGKEAIAEGVETQTQLDYIEKAGCKVVQGYIFDKPLPEEEFTERLENGYEE